MSQHKIKGVPKNSVITINSVFMQSSTFFDISFTVDYFALILIYETMI